MTLPESPTNKNTFPSLLAIASLIIGVLFDIPAVALCWFMALGIGLGAHTETLDRDTAYSLTCLFTPFGLCLLGIITGIIGLRSHRRPLAIIGILLSGAILLLMISVIGLFFIATSLAS